MRLSLVAVAVFLAAALSARGVPERPGEVGHGRAVYAAECASCHGTALEGQPHWWEPGADGLLPAPPHDATGHTWQHSDRELVELITHGTGGFAAPGYRSGMPAYAGRLSAGQVANVIAYIKSTWPPGIRAYQAAQNPGGPPLGTSSGDWTFPPTCGYHFPSNS